MKILEIKTELRELGSFGEEAAASFLRKSGYKILERGFVAFGHEIDIIAQDKTVTAFVEVKTRTVGYSDPREPRPASAVTQKKQRGIISAAKAYAAMARDGKRMRFDIIEVYAEKDERGRWSAKEIKHLKGAFDRNTATPPYKPSN